jgi:hypothetical protein
VRPEKQTPNHERRKQNVTATGPSPGRQLASSQHDVAGVHGQGGSDADELFRAIEQRRKARPRRFDRKLTHLIDPVWHATHDVGRLLEFAQRVEVVLVG